MQSIFCCCPCHAQVQVKGQLTEKDFIMFRGTAAAVAAQASAAAPDAAADAPPEAVQADAAAQVQYLHVWLVGAPHSL